MSYPVQDAYRASSPRLAILDPHTPTLSMISSATGNPAWHTALRSGADARQFPWAGERLAADRLAEMNGLRAAEVAEHTVSHGLV